jgi:hypothetical protein
MAKHVGYHFALNGPRVNEQLDKLDGFDGRAERDGEMSREAWRAPEGVTLCMLSWTLKDARWSWPKAAEACGHQ